MASAFGIVTSTPRRVNVFGLQEYRPAGALSFIGRYRLIDFPISNMSNSGIDYIQVYLRKNPQTLTDHLGSGRQYNINSKKGRLQLLYCNNSNRNEVYNTDISNYLLNMIDLNLISKEYVVIAPCYMIYKQNYAELLQQHIDSGADITMLYHKVTNGRDHFLNCRVMGLDKDGKVTSLSENHGNRASQNVFMDTYVMHRELFLTLVQKTAEYSSTYSLAQMIGYECQQGSLNIHGIQHKGYFAAICDMQAYYDANMDMLDLKKARELFSADWTVYTKTDDSAPTKILEGADVRRSVVSDGCEIAGEIENSVIGRGVHIGKGAIVKNSIVSSYAQIGPGVHLENEVVDKWARIIHTKEMYAPSSEPGYVRKGDIL